MASAAVEAARIQWIGSSFRGSMKQLSGSAGLCVCRPHSACYFLEVIRPTLPHQEKALMISGSHEICTACRSCPLRFTEPRFCYLVPPPPPFHCPFLLPRPLSSSPPFIEELLPSFSTKCVSRPFPRNPAVCHPPPISFSSYSCSSPSIATFLCTSTSTMNII